MVNLKGTKHNDKLQTYYMYAGEKDMQFTESNVPTVVVDGKIEIQPAV